MGFQSFVGFNRKTGLGVVALSNTAAVMGVDDIGLHLMTGGPLKTATKSRVAVPLPAAAFDKLVGRYAMAPGVVMTIRRDGERMIGQLTGQPPVELFAESPTTFFLKVVDAQLTFTVDTEGRGTAVTLRTVPATAPGQGRDPVFGRVGRPDRELCAGPWRGDLRDTQGPEPVRPDHRPTCVRGVSREPDQGRLDHRPRRRHLHPGPGREGDQPDPAPRRAKPAGAAVALSPLEPLA
jgi:hypothetical protein